MFTDKTAPRPSLETLEERAVPAVSAQLSRAGVLGVWGDSGHNTLNVRQVNNTLAVDGVSIYNFQTNRWVSRVSVASVARIEVVGYGGNDVINLNSGAVAGQQAITRPAVIWGGDGHDRITAGMGHDIVYAGAGDDRVWGNGGDDQLVGEAGADTLYGNAGQDRQWGGAGNDGLFGGPGHDHLVGNDGADRFLTQPGDAVYDSGAADANLSFVDGQRAWAEQEILAIDEALARLHTRTNNTRLLKLANGGPMRFVRQLADGNSAADNDSSGTINVYDGAFVVGGQAHRDAGMIITHEIGHNWDSNDDSFGRENPTISEFRALSGWTSTPPATGGYVQAPTSAWGVWWYRGDAVFVRDYSRNNPLEDFADSFTVALGYGPNNVPAKVAQINRFLNTLFSW
jgi:hypothetical protein